MKFRDRTALSLPPLLLRLALGLTFVFAGGGKLFTERAFEPAEAAVLANMGVKVRSLRNANGNHSAPPESPAAPSDEPTEALPDSSAPPTTDRQPPAEPESKPSSTPIAADSAPGAPLLVLAAAAPPGPANGAKPSTTPAFTAADFPTAIDKARVYDLALMLHYASNPPEGTGATWPAAWSQGLWPARLAWAVAITEFVGGAFLLIGLMTRLAALGVAGVMLGALWLASIGPIVMGPADAASFLGVFPPIDFGDPAASQAWTNLLFQFCLFMSAMALALSRPGLLSLDRLVFGGPSDHDLDDHEDWADGGEE